MTSHEIIAGVRKTDAGHFQPFIMERTSEGLREILALQAVRLRYEAAAIAERMARDERTRRETRAKLTPHIRDDETRAEFVQRSAAFYNRSTDEPANTIECDEPQPPRDLYATKEERDRFTNDTDEPASDAAKISAAQAAKARAIEDDDRDAYRRAVAELRELRPE